MIDRSAQFWPVPRPSWRARLFCATKLPDKTVPFRAGRIELAAEMASAPSVPLRFRRLAAGRQVQLRLLIEGERSWCPPFPEGHPVRLTADTATSDGGGGPGTQRAIPLEALRIDGAVLLDPPSRPIVPGLETWTLTTRQPEGTATITGLLADLALLAAVAHWPPPPDLLAHRHAGAVGARPGPSPRRPPIRPLGWLLIAVGVLVLAAGVASLVLTQHAGRGIGGVGGLAGLLLLGGWRLRRPRDRDDDRHHPAVPRVDPDT